MAEYDIIIKGGTIIDGTNIPRYTGDLAIKGDRIVKMGGLRGSTATKTLDASGLIVAPASLTFTPATMPRSNGTPIALCRDGTA